MPSRFQGLVDSTAESVAIDYHYAVGDSLPAGAVGFRGFNFLNGQILATEDDGAVALTYLGGLAFTAKGLLVVDSGAVGTSSTLPGGLLVNERGALHLQLGSSTVHLAGVPVSSTGALSGAAYLTDDTGVVITDDTGAPIEVKI
jgi:hypothetical protein